MGDSNFGAQTKKIVFVTVGTTRFDALIKAVDTKEVKEELFKRGAGSGSIFETLRNSKPLIVVVNEDLMDNHQQELAEELAERKHLFCARPGTLSQTLANMKLESLVQYPSCDASTIVRLMSRFLGLPDD